MTEKQSATINKVSYWEASAGDTVTGVIHGTGAFGDAVYDEYKTMLLRQEDGAVVGVVLNRYLMHSLQQRDAALGDFVTVTFHGKEQKNNGRSFNRYTLLVDKCNGTG
jgi:hypothetical protein